MTFFIGAVLFIQTLEIENGSGIMFGIGDQPVTISRQFNYAPNDIALAFTNVAIGRYGEDSLRGAKLRFWSRRSIFYLTIKTGFNQEDKGIFGGVHIENLKLHASFIVCPQDEDGFCPEIRCLVQPKYRQEAENFLDAVKEYLTEHSIYKGKAIKINCDFVDVSGINESGFIYSQEISQQLKANIWTIIEQPERCAQVKIKRQRKILLAGTYGAGKTFTALLTAKKAIDNGWTFIYLPPTDKWDEDSFLYALELARKYQPAVVFVEDIDHEQRFDSDYVFKKILSDVDGLVSKNDEILMVMTTNRPDKIDGALLRPGRIDRIIKLGKLTKRDIERMITLTIDKNFLDENIKWDELAKICLSLNYPPAFVMEIAKDALLLMISENREKVTTEMLVQSAESLKGQVKSCNKPLGFSEE